MADAASDTDDAARGHRSSAIGDGLNLQVWPELQEAIEANSTWEGSLTGLLVRSGPGAPWELCRSVPESAPPQCEDGLAFVPSSDLEGRAVSCFRRSGGVLWSQEVITVEGVFDADSLQMRERHSRESDSSAGDGRCDAIVLVLPDPGQAASSFTSIGPIWVVRHRDGSVSAFAGWVAEHARSAEYSMDGVGQLISWSEPAEQFRAGDRYWDQWGRPLSDDTKPLAGFDAAVEDDEVRVFEMSLPVVGEGDGDAAPGARFELPALPDAVGLADANLTAGWTLVDAALVFHEGSGWLCDIDTAEAVSNLLPCGNPDGIGAT